MSITGRYKFNKETGKLVKVSDEIPKIATDCYCPEGGYCDDNLGEWNEKKEVFEPYHVTSKMDKQRRMKELGLQEKGGKDVKPHGKTQYHDMTVRDRATVFVGRR